MKTIIYLIVAAAALIAAGLAFDYASKPNFIQATELKDSVPAPVMTFKDMKGNELTWESINTPYIVVNFWATWCAPCKEEMPLLAKLADTYQDKMTVVAISVDDAKTDINQFLGQFDAVTQRQLSKVIFVHDSKQLIARKFQVYRFPETYLLDDKRTVKQKIGGQLRPKDLLLAD